LSHTLLGAINSLAMLHVGHIDPKLPPTVTTDTVVVVCQVHVEFATVVGFALPRRKALILLVAVVAFDH
jgi:hypothetical protein